MKRKINQLVVYGEVLFDCFPDGEVVLGGAPFNVAWHLQAMGDEPVFISRVGKDDLGSSILKAMQDWNMSREGMQLDSTYMTGQVRVSITNNEPSYEIKEPCAYDFIDEALLTEMNHVSVIYHGSLALRHEKSRTTLQHLIANHNAKLFLDVNLRTPWWNKQDLETWMASADWVKLNHEELAILSPDFEDLQTNMTKLHAKFKLQHLIVTQGDAGATVCDETGHFHQIKPSGTAELVDTVGAGDAFTAMYLHGLAAGWTVPNILEASQAFAEKVIAIRGAISNDKKMYT